MYFKRWDRPDSNLNRNLGEGVPYRLRKWVHYCVELKKTQNVYKKEKGLSEIIKKNTSPKPPKRANRQTSQQALKRLIHGG